MDIIYVHSFKKHYTRVSEIMERLNAGQLTVRIGTLIPVINHLIERGYLTTLESDRKGNDLLKLTERGQKLA